MHGLIFAILVLVLSAAATASVAQGMGQETLSADPRTLRMVRNRRCGVTVF